MAKAVTIESQEDELRPMFVKPQDSEFKQDVRLSIDAETSKDFAGREKVLWSEAEDFYNKWLLASFFFKELARAFEPIRLSDVAKRMTSDYVSDYISKIDRVNRLLAEKWLVEVKKEPIFGVSLTGVHIKDDEIRIDPKEFQPDVFYLFSYKNEKYVARKIDETTVEIYEVLE